MDIKPIALSITPNDVLTLRSVRIVHDGARYIVGVEGNKSYLSTSAAGAEAVRLLDAGASIDAASLQLSQMTQSKNVDIFPLVERLVNAGIVRAISGRELESRGADIRRPAMRVRPERVAWLFSPAMLAVYAAAVIAAFICLAAERSLLAPPAALYAFGYAVMVPAGLAAGLLNAAKHELCHALAAWRLGASVRFSIGFKYIFPVFQTDLTDIWLVSRRKRYIAFLAGMGGDTITLAVIVLFLSVSRRLLPPHPAVAAAATLLVYAAAAHVVWQFAIFTRTDLYYVLANAFATEDLHREAEKYLLSLVPFRARAKQSGSTGAAPRRPILVYAFVMAGGYTVCTAAVMGYLYFLAAFFRPDPAHSVSDKIAVAISPLIAISALLWSKLRAPGALPLYSVSRPNE